jgi:endonuclease-3
VLDRLVSVYGEPSAIPERTVFEWLVHENVVYLADDAARELAFLQLQQRVGLTPEALLAAPDAALAQVASGGILPATQVEKLRRIAALAPGAELDSIGALSLKEAKRVLRRFPAIGEPGAEKVLLFAGTHAVLGLDSNGVRVLTRLGLVLEGKSYAATYRAVQAFAAPYLERGVEWLVRAHQLLRRHGQELCRRSRPLCDRCPLTDVCAYYAGTGAAPSGAPSADQVSPR